MKQTKASGKSGFDAHLVLVDLPVAGISPWAVRVLGVAKPLLREFIVNLFL